ncbi:uncharacterized protein PV09_00378 [Verruconis gallopava]|uniref:Aminotransferase class I/classII large domain-containing protein n=1 Tax=Verruconis gallopava TaxID=253628 RepID=A0A0D1Y3K6_9PEZI|nr:uncharacterized protein PV09_00378 [Verruconis gallopava]KIW09501.1 hypothetical protein PV09_00378 [Verruconis gallopava]
MDGNFGFNKLHYWLCSGKPDTISIGGSAPPSLTLSDMVELSTDPKITQAALDFGHIKFDVGSPQGNRQLRETIAATYNKELSQLSPDDVIVANGTTGANHIVHQSLLKSGDHVICQYPAYGPCIEEPEHIGCNISYLRLDPDNGWALDMKQLEGLIRPGRTKLLVVNNPVNPTGTHLTTAEQREIVALCKKYNVVVHCDENFHSLYHADGDVPTSVIEHAALDYDNVVVTQSLSKVYGLSGVRIGWIVTRSADLRKTFLSYRVMSLVSVSLIDEAIALEVLGPRVRPRIVSKNLQLAKTNIGLLQAFIDAHPEVCDWVPPTAGSTVFVKFKDPGTGELVDEVDFCKKLHEKKKLMLAPGTICFGHGDLKDEFKGRIRIHFTCPTEKLKAGLQLLDEFLAEL